MSFELEMIVPREGVDDLGQQAEASITFLHYSLELGYHHHEDLRSLGTLEILKEELRHINRSNASKHLLFNCNKSWQKAVIMGKRTSPFISSVDLEGGLIIRLHQDGIKGKPLSRLAARLPRTVLSVANAAESPTVLLARREMQSWQLLQLEPSPLRQPDEFSAPTHLGSDGSHLAATLYNLARLGNNEEHIYAQVANRLSELLDDVDAVWIDRDDRRELLTLMVKSRDGTIHPARSLSDGTMRFLALVVLELNPESIGLLCLEEPENGIHPERIPKIISLLQDIATDVNEPVDDVKDSSLKQVIINTHSPAVVQQVPDDSLLVAEVKEDVNESGQRFNRVCFNYLTNTWRSKIPDFDSISVISNNNILAYLNPISNQMPRQKRVVDREDLQLLIPGLLD
jgi:predicted ATPase